MKLYWLSLGWMETDKNYMYAGASRATYSNQTAENIWCRVPIECAYINHPKGKIMIDAGCNHTALTNGQNTRYIEPENDNMDYQLALCGAKPEDIDYVIITHMHVDHIGDLAKFKNAKILVQREEFIQAFMTVHTTNAGGGSYIREDVEADVKYTLIDGDYELFPDVKIITLPGHTDGQVGVQLEMKDGTVIFCSDAINTSYNYEHMMPPAKAPWDSKAYRASIEKVRAIAEKTKAKLIFGHDEQQWETIKKAPFYYE